jgi:hypothetical protein
VARRVGVGAGVAGSVAGGVGAGVAGGVAWSVGVGVAWSVSVGVAERYSGRRSSFFGSLVSPCVSILKKTANWFRVAGQQMQHISRLAKQLTRFLSTETFSEPFKKYNNNNKM